MPPSTAVPNIPGRHARERETVIIENVAHAVVCFGFADGDLAPFQNSRHRFPKRAKSQKGSFGETEHIPHKTGSDRP